jgi:hypothetical protein
LIVALDESDRYPAVCEVLLRRHPGMKVLALAAGRNVSLFFWASFCIDSLPVEPSEEGILNTLRSRIGGLA